MAKVRYDLPKHKRINKICGTCGRLIYFIRNSSGKYVPFNFDNEKCHYEECTSPPNTINPPKEQGLGLTQKPKIKYAESQKNRVLTGFIE